LVCITANYPTGLPDSQTFLNSLLEIEKGGVRNRFTWGHRSENAQEAFLFLRPELPRRG